jgi:Tfp pilus assembly protein PilO
MRGDAVDQLLGTLRPEAALAALGALVALTLLAGHLYVIKPSLTKLRALDIEGSRDSLENVTAAVAEGEVAIATLEVELAELRDRLYGGPSDLPPEKTESYIIDRLDRISEQHAVELVSVRPGDGKEVLMFDELLYEVEVKGRFFALVAWLREMEDELRPMVVNEFELRPESEAGSVAMKLRLASYRPSGGVT